MKYQVFLHPQVVEEDLVLLPKNIRDSIYQAIGTRLSNAPDRLGKPLSWEMKGYRRLRIGDYRVIYKLQGNDVHVMCVGHRKNIYNIFLRRID